MKNTSTGFGLALLAGAIVTHTLVTNLASTANASAVTSAASAVSTAAAAQTGPTIVWYGSMGSQTLVRSWSTGRVEAMLIDWIPDGACAYPTDHRFRLRSCGGWQVISDPAQGLTYRSDINFDAKVDGADLSRLLSDWGDAPRQDVPPSDCPLALINP
jgi:hypothetical protein